MGASAVGRLSVARGKTGVTFKELSSGQREDAGATRTGGGLLLDFRLGGDPTGFEKPRVNGVKLARVGEEDAAPLRPSALGLEDLGNTGSAGTGGI